MNRFLYSLISFIIALFFILVGIIAVMVPWTAAIRTALTQFILEDSLTISLFGFAFIVIGFSIVVNVLLNARRAYYQIKSGSKKVLVDENVIQQYLTSYWKQLFPEKEVPSRLVLKNNKIYITVDFPYLPNAQQRSFLERVKNDLSASFAKTLNYRDEFYLYASFQSGKD